MLVALLANSVYCCVPENVAIVEGMSREDTKRAALEADTVSPGLARFRWLQVVTWRLKVLYIDGGLLLIQI